MRLLPAALCGTLVHSYEPLAGFHTHAGSGVMGAAQLRFDNRLVSDQNDFMMELPDRPDGPFDDRTRGVVTPHRIDSDSHQREDPSSPLPFFASIATTS